ncbi:MAG: SsrA-binding protein SmpB, partial [Candidatus Electryonea clarkiae]|nr:SsrA-binding protein SmpB [Candidatus Electryonea clarkiae]
TPEIRNRKARHDYFIVESLEAGIMLHGTEIKSIRAGMVSLREAHVIIEKGVAMLIGMSIAHYVNRGYADHQPFRPRRLLLHKREIKRLARKALEKGLTIVPLRLYFNDRGYAKVEIALAKGKRQYDKRATIAERDAKRDLQRITKRKYEN